MKKLFNMFMVIIMITMLSAPRLAQAATVKMSKAKATLEVDATLQLYITSSEGTVIWTSSRNTIVTVSKKGLVTAVKAGTATITATIDSKDYLCSVFVVNSKNASVTVGETAEFTSGEYLIGDDIPAGTYTLEITDGYGTVYLYNIESDYDNDERHKNSIWLSATEGNENEKTYKNIKFKQKNYIVISDGMIINFKRTK